MKQDQRRRLTDLYSRGRVFSVLDEDGNEALQVYVRKMTPADAEVAYLKASAKRASVLALSKEDEPSDTIVTLQSQLEQLTKENLVEWKVAQGLVERRPEVETRVAFEEEWAKDNYLFSLQERTTQADYQAKVEELPDDPEVVRISGEIGRYTERVEQEMKTVETDLRFEFDQQPESQLRKAIQDTMVEAQADASWLNEFQKCQVWKCIFDADDKRDPYFATREEVDQVQIEVLGQLADFIDKVHVSDQEGKDSPQTPVS